MERPMSVFPPAAYKLIWSDTGVMSVSRKCSRERKWDREKEEGGMREWWQSPCPLPAQIILSARLKINLHLSIITFLLSKWRCQNIFSAPPPVVVFVVVFLFHLRKPGLLRHYQEFLCLCAFHKEVVEKWWGKWIRQMLMCPKYRH